MNFSYPVFYSKENLTTRFLDYANVSVLPVICFMGMITSLCCLLGSFKKRGPNNKVFDYIFINSCVDLLFLLTQFFGVIVRCGSLCPYGYDYISKFYEIYIFWLVGYSLVNTQVLFSIYMAYDRLKMFSATTELIKTSLYSVFGVCLTVGLLLNIIPYGVSKQILPWAIYKPDPNITQVLYQKQVRKEFQTIVGQNILTIILTIKDPFMYLVLCVMNFQVCVRFRQYLKKKEKLVNDFVPTSDSISNISKRQAIKTKPTAGRRERNLAMMTIVFCVVYLIGNFIDCFSVIAATFKFDLYLENGYVNVVGNILFYASHSVHLFIYLYFNKPFRDQFPGCIFLDTLITKTTKLLRPNNEN